jgi:hypothetical protein
MNLESDQRRSAFAFFSLMNATNDTDERVRIEATRLLKSLDENTAKALKP